MHRISLVTAALIFFASAAFAQKDDGKAVEFTLKDTKGESHALADQKGKIVVLEWVNKDCPVVQRHYKDDAMQNLAKKWMKKGVIWWAIDSTNYAKAEAVEEWRVAKKADQPILLDPTGEVGRAYGAKTTPHMYIVKDGAILYQGGIDDGAKDDATVNYVDRALGEISEGKAVSEPKAPPYGCSVKYAKASKAPAAPKWTTDYRAALAAAKAEKKIVLLDFTGSDWCVWCKRLKSEVFDTDAFRAWAAKNVILVEVDFPRKKELEQALAEQNAGLKTKFEIKGYPTIVFVDGDEKEVGRSGYVEGGPEAWIESAQKAIKK